MSDNNIERGNPMASWMVHLRIADNILSELSELSPKEFVVGNIAPDSGVPNEDWSAYIPSGDVSHFKTTDAEGFKDIHINEYVEQFYSAIQRKQYTVEQKSFYLGYLTHLITDMMWSELIVRPSMYKFKALYDMDRNEWIRTLKKDWYDLDFLYLKKHPNFSAYSTYRKATGFENKYLDIFSTDAFDKKRVYITNFYNNMRSNIEREYNCLSEKEMDNFVSEASAKILQKLREEYI